MTKKELQTINKDIDYILGILDYYKIGLEGRLDDDEQKELVVDFVKCENLLHNIGYLINLKK